MPVWAELHRTNILTLEGYHMGLDTEGAWLISLGQEKGDIHQYLQ